MAYLHDDVLDAALQELITNVNALHICSQEPANYTEATATYTVGVKATPTLGAQANGATTGRRTTVAAFSDGEVTATGTASHWALVDTVGERLLATGALSASQAVTDGNTFSLTAFDVTIPDAAA